MKHASLVLTVGLLSAFPSFAAVAVPPDSLKLYASFDNGIEPDIAAAGVRVHHPVKFVPADGRYGGGASFRKEDGAGDLWYVLGDEIGRKGWTVALWMCLDAAGGRYGQGQHSRGIFRTTSGWGRGNAFATFDDWGKLCFSHLADDGAYKGAHVGGAAVPAKKWTHLAFTCDKRGHHAVFVNGNEASYLRNSDVKTVTPLREIRIGSMDFTRGDLLQGQLDELMVFDRALDATEIKAAMETIPGCRTADVALYLPCDGEVKGRGIASFSAVDLVFAKGYSDDGVKIVRHGYDRRAILSAGGFPVGGAAASAFLYFAPDWSGTDDEAVHGLLAAGGKDFRWALAKRGKDLSFEVTSSEKSAVAKVPASGFAKGRTSRVAAGYDFAARKIYVSLDGVCSEAAFDLPRPVAIETTSLVVGDVRGADTYSKTQAEGVLDEILVVNGYLSEPDLAEVVGTEIRKKGDRKSLTLANTPVTEREAALWDLSGAETRTTAGRTRVTLNALWRFQLTDESRAYDPADWLYLAVPGRYSGQENGGADSEFYPRDKRFRKMPEGWKYAGKDGFKFVNGWFERAFRADPAWKDREIVLKIDELSNSQSGEAYLNGKLLGRLPAGALFELPVPWRLLKENDWNFITIHAVDGGQRWAWRGVKGDVSLEIREALHVEEPEILTSVKDGTFAATLMIANSSSKDETVIVEAEVSGPNAPATLKSSAVVLKGGERTSVTLRTAWKDAKLWDVDSPTLYACTFRVKDAAGRVRDEPQPVRFGFREFEIRGRDFYLNGKKIHLFIHDEWVNGRDEASVRETARMFKKLGYNTIRMNFSGQEIREENVIRACDEAGLLYLVNVNGVSGRDYALWGDPEVRAQLESRMRTKIVRWRNHASAVVWYLSINFLGYVWDYHPLKIADGYEPPGRVAQDKYRVCLEGVKILRKYDAAKRPYFFQAGGNFGEIETSNAYFCWWPQTERDAWPAEWSRIGKKPLIPIETSFPYVLSFYGMDFPGSNPPPLFYRENLARYYGPSAYAEDDQEMEAEVRRSMRDGRGGEVWYDAPALQRLKSDLLTETLRHWRGFDLSGICPFAEFNYAFGRQAARHVRHSAKTTQCPPPNDFRRFGWTPDAVKVPYQQDVDFSNPLPTCAALAVSFAPKFAFFDGGAEEPVDGRMRYRGGERLEKRLVLINDTRTETVFAGQWTLGPASMNFREKLQPGERAFVPVSVELPKVEDETRLRLVAAIDASGPVVAEPLEIVVCPEPRAAGLGEIALYDTCGLTSAKLRRLGVGFREVRFPADFRGGLLVVGADSLTPEFARLAAAARLADAVNAGRAQVLVLAQKPEALRRIGLRTTPVYARAAYDAKGVAYDQWAGRSTLSPEKQPPDPKTEDEMPRRQFFHWNNANIVSSYPILRPSEGSYEVMLSCGKDLVYTPLLEMASGKGKIVFCQLEVEHRTQADVQADGLLIELLRRCSRKADVKTGSFEIVGVDRAEEFGVAVAVTNIVRFAVSGAERGMFGMLSARDTYLREPVAVSVFSGEGVESLLEPAFAAAKTVGGKRIVFLGLPENPCAETFARAEKVGRGSSAGWAAEAVANRLRQVRSLVERASGAAASGVMADRLEAQGEVTVGGVFPYTHSHFDYPTETHVRW